MLKLFSDRKLDSSDTELPAEYEVSEPWGEDVEDGEVVYEIWLANNVHTRPIRTGHKA